MLPRDRGHRPAGVDRVPWLGRHPALHPSQEGPGRGRNGGSPETGEEHGSEANSHCPESRWAAGGREPAEGHTLLRNHRKNQPECSILTRVASLKKCLCRKRQRKEVEIFQVTKHKGDVQQTRGKRRWRGRKCHEGRQGASGQSRTRRYRRRVLPIAQIYAWRLLSREM